MPAAAKKTTEPPEEAEEEPSMFFDWDGLPVYRDAKGFMVITVGGDERPIEDLWKFQHQAVPIEEDAFEELKKTVSEKPEPEKGAKKEK
jgi:hypothetical protein